MMRLSEFQNGKLSLFSLKIEQDRANNVKCKILKNGSFNKVKQKLYFLKFGILHL